MEELKRLDNGLDIHGALSSIDTSASVCRVPISRDWKPNSDMNCQTNTAAG